MDAPRQLRSRRVFRRDGVEPCIVPLPQDHRFAAEAWQKPPFNLFYQGFLLHQQWWHNATTGLRGMPRQEQAVLEFAGRQLLDLFSPPTSSSPP
jgi:polyhydroxyalkanoate synthase